MAIPTILTGYGSWIAYGNVMPDDTSPVTLASLKTHFGVTDENQGLGHAARLPTIGADFPRISGTGNPVALAGNAYNIPGPVRTDLPTWELRMPLANLAAVTTVEGSAVQGTITPVVALNENDPFYILWLLTEPGAGMGEVAKYYQNRLDSDPEIIPAPPGSTDVNQVALSLALQAKPISLF